MVICVSWIRRQSEKNGFKYSCIWNWLVCFVSAAQNRALTTISKIFQGFSWFCRFLYAVNMTYPRLPFSFIVFFLSSFSLWFFVSAAGCTRTLNKPQNGLFFSLHLFVSTEKEIIKLQPKQWIEKVLIFFHFNQKTALRYKLPTYDLVSWVISFRMAQIHYVYFCGMCCLFLESRIQVWLYKII